jgi:type II secretory pathway pseudopilin PulG
MGVLFAVVGVVIVVLIALASLAFFRSIADERARAAERRAAQLEALLDEVKEVAWTNRDIAPELSTIIIDTIRSGEQENRRRELP